MSGLRRAELGLALPGIALGLVLVIVSRPDRPGPSAVPANLANPANLASPASPDGQDSGLRRPPVRSVLEPVDGLVRRETMLMGTLFTFAVEAPREVALEATASAIAHIRDLEARISTYRPHSEISQLNARAGVGPVTVHPDTFELLRTAKRLAIDTGGAFDVTIGPVWDLWPFRDPGAKIPGDEAIREALALVGASRIELDAGSRTAYLPVIGMRVNLGAIGKGHAAALAIQRMREMGIARAAVSAGGDVHLLGSRKSGPWVIGVEDPRWEGRLLDRFVGSDIAVATSGDRRRFIGRDGRRYGHILDPRSGRPAEGCQSVTIRAGDPAVADALATAVFVMGPDEGLRWVEEQPGVEVLILDQRGRVRRSAGWTSDRQPEGEPPSLTARLPGRPGPRGPSESPHDAKAGGHEPAFMLRGGRSGRDPDARGRDHDQRTTPAVPVSRADPDPGPGPEPGDGSGIAAGAAGNPEGMVRVPTGLFLGGDPPRSRECEAFWIDETEVSNRDYRQFLDAIDAHGHRWCHPEEPRAKDHVPRYHRRFIPQLVQERTGGLASFDEGTFRRPDHPVVGVDWWDAFAYAAWEGKRLPTRLEWERAARGTDGRIWPWGNDWARRRANAGGEKWEERDGHTYAAPVRSFANGISPIGCLNMAGNVAEWTLEGFVAGGSSADVPSALACTAGRFREPGYRAFDIGFRCAAGGGPRS